jgi:hypothetical protein
MWRNGPFVMFFEVLTINSERPVGFVVIGKLLLLVFEVAEPHFCRLIFSFTSTKERSIEVHD